MAGVPGKGGRPPKREDQRRRRNKPDAKVEHAFTLEAEPPEPRADLCERAAEWYRSLASSGQAQFYTASDWQVALICAEAIEIFMETGRATILAEIRSLQTQLLSTEGERRRARLELEKASDGEEVADVADADVWRRRLEARKSG